MKRLLLTILAVVVMPITFTSCGRHIRTAQDITPGNFRGERLDWRYGAGDIRIQTSKVTAQLMDQWYSRTGCADCNPKPRIIITQIDNRTDCYISTDMIRDVFESVAVDDGRFSVIVGDSRDEQELDCLMTKIQRNPKYSNSSRLQSGQVVAPQFLGKVRITKAMNSDRRYDYEDYRMTVSLYDIETQEIVDSAWDVLSKRVEG